MKKVKIIGVVPFFKMIIKKFKKCGNNKLPNSKAMIHAEYSELEEIKSLERDIVKLE